MLATRKAKYPEFPSNFLLTRSKMVCLGWAIPKIFLVVLFHFQTIVLVVFHSFSCQPFIMWYVCSISECYEIKLPTRCIFKFYWLPNTVWRHFEDCKLSSHGIYIHNECKHFKYFYNYFMGMKQTEVSKQRQFQNGLT